MTDKELIALIQGDKDKLKKWFNAFDSKSNNINDWQKLLHYPLEPHSYAIVHKIRSSIQSGLSYYFGVKHLDGKKFPNLANKSFKMAIDYITEGEEIRKVMVDIYPKIIKLLNN